MNAACRRLPFQWIWQGNSEIDKCRRRKEQRDNVRTLTDVDEINDKITTRCDRRQDDDAIEDKMNSEIHNEMDDSTDDAGVRKTRCIARQQNSDKYKYWRARRFSY